MNKSIRHNISLERHNLTKEMKLDLYTMRNTRAIPVINFIEGRLCGMAAAYHILGIIDMKARRRYIDIIVDTAYKRRKELANEV